MDHVVIWLGCKFDLNQYMTAKQLFKLIIQLIIIYHIYQLIIYITAIGN